VDDRSLRAGGTQSISTPEGYMFPLDIIDGLVYLRMRPFTDEEYAALPHVPFTSDVTWDATVLDCTISDNPNWHDHLNGGEYESHFDAQGNYLHRDRGETIIRGAVLPNCATETKKNGIVTLHLVIRPLPG
jgi:hypothetical protein